MSTDEPAAETTVSDSGTVSIPESVRRRLDIDGGDTLRWSVEDGTLRVDVVDHRPGAFDDAPTAPLGGDGLETHDESGYEAGVEDEH